MHVQAWDTAFVRARRRDIHPILRNPAGYGRWWPGADSRPAGDLVALTLCPPGLFRRRQRLLVAVAKDRRDLGVLLSYRGDLPGEAEWYYLDEPAGVVVHYLLRAEARDRRAGRLLRDHRAAVRAALDSLKDRFEGARLPGAEPDPRLLEHQRSATAEFRARVEAHARRVANPGGAGGADARPEGG